MQRYCRLACCVLFLIGLCTAVGADWRQFRGPGGLGASAEKGLPVKWSSTENIVWRTKLPGPGASSPVTVGNLVFVTCYSGYGLDPKEPGKQEDLRRHLLCVDRLTGNILWTKDFEPSLPEHKYSGEGSYHGYAGSTPATDGERLYVFFGKSGVFCFDLGGKALWQATVGKGTNGWGSGASPLLYKDLVIVNASVESGAMVAFDKMSGREVWKAAGEKVKKQDKKKDDKKDKKHEEDYRIRGAWNTPMVVSVPSKAPELIISVENRVLAFNPDDGSPLWNADGVHRYCCPSVVQHDGVVYVIGGGHTSLAVKAGGRGDVTNSHVVWRLGKGSNVASPVYHEGHLYWAGDNGMVFCQDAATGKIVYDVRLDPPPPEGKVWASPVLADGKLYYVSRLGGAYVVAATPKYELLAHNVLADDKSRASGSVAVSEGQLLYRTDQYLYCIGKKGS
jgi:outer membrane protein assembly factor BamB